LSTLNLGFEDKLWQMADKLRGNIESSEYKHVILGLVFLKYISDSFTERYEEIKAKYPGMEEDRDAYESENVFFVPKEARWDYIKSQAKQPTIGQIIDNAMVLIERENANTLKNVLPKNYARPELDKTRLGELIDLFSFNVGSREARAKDVLGRVYEYFLKKFGTTEGEFYTPPSIVKLLVNMIEPYSGRVYDPCCGSGGMFVQSAKFVQEHSGKLDSIHVFGQEYVATTWRLAKMNLAIRGIDANLGERDADTFTKDQHKTLRADYILANPPFNIKDWGHQHLTDDPRWKWGTPPAGNANYAWISHIISKLSPRGIAGFVLANGSLSTSRNEEYTIRKNILEEGLVDCIIAMPPQLFYDVSIPVSLWFLSKNKNGRKEKVLFIDARKMGYMETRKHRELKDVEIETIYSTYHKWREDKDYQDVDGFCKSASLEEVRSHDYVLTPSRYVGIEEVEDDGIPFDEKMDILTSELSELFEESKSLEEKIKENLRGIGYGI